MTKEKHTDNTEGRFAYDGLDRILHEKSRLGILTSLATHPEGLLFNELKELCSLTDGNLSRHLQTLQEAELIELWKRFKDKRPQTLCRITPKGKQRFMEYIAELEQVIRDTSQILKDEKKKEHISDKDITKGWSPA